MKQGELGAMFQGINKKAKKKRKTILRTVRISEEVDQLLQKTALEKQVSLNTLISNVLIQYIDWGRFTDKFGIVSIQREILRSMIEALNDEQLENIARKLGSTLPKEAMIFWFKQVNASSFLSAVSNIFRYGKIAD